MSLDEIKKHEGSKDDEQNINNKIKSIFINTVSESARFTDDEIEEIILAISSSQKADKMAEIILESIEGANNEDN